MRKIILATVILTMLLSGEKLFAQQEAMYTQYMFNTLSINPAYAGSRNVLSATTLIRSQWTGIEGAPRTTTFTIDAPINRKKVGLGLQVFKDKIGIMSTTGIVGTYAYRIRMDRASLSFGLQGGISQFRANYTGVQLEPYGPSNDVAFGNNANTNFYNVGAGVYYNSDKFYLGLSSPQLMQNVMPSYSGEQSKNNRQFSHIFLMGGYVFSLNEDFKLKPSFLVKAVKGAPLEGDINANLWIRNTFSIGAQYRTNADVSGMVEFQVSPQIRVGYAYDHSLTDLQSYNSGSHEIMLRFELGLERNRVISPRYF
ncbi:PorP/SprF family type IX secretion system membrane protein [Desertivirga arenae]|uniref:PorP/SprF family type IX secretion system membrane protein n=1 Tax=Desertivirga arenae TaxID=2810309 RepID=UPI001A96727D|nr:type IX secretion system membrane protein PorP/SprF [Pedobacter sp. SYSU D00823]